MKTGQLILSVIGLVAIILAYVTERLEFLIIALAAFIGGLYFMGALGKRPVTKEEDGDDTKNGKKNKSTSNSKSAKNAKDKSRNEQ